MKNSMQTKFNNRIFVYFTISACLIILLLTFFFLQSFSKTIRNEGVQVTDNTIKKSGYNLERYLNQMKDLSIILENNPLIKSYFSSNDESAANQQEIEKVLVDVVAVKSDIVSIVLVGRDGRIVSNEQMLPMELSKDMMGMPWYSETLASSGKPILTSARMQGFSANKDAWVISLCREMKSSDGTNAGLIIIDLNYNVIDDVLGDLDLGTKGSVFVVNDKGQAVYHEDISYFTDPEKMAQLKESAFSENNDDQFVKSSYHLENADWLIVAYASLDALNMIQRNIIYMVAISTIVLVGLASISSLKINKLVKDIKENEEILRKTELSALQSQINPHFLYNSLETIIWMAEFKESNKVIEITRSLARFFRLSLNSSPMTSLENEIEHTKKYLEIQSYRYENLLNYEFDIDDRFLSWKVPKLILQPIVENAIDHGIRGKKEGGTIRISTALNNDYLEIIVTDDGIGFNCEEDYFLPSSQENTQPLYTEDAFEKPHSGIGLKNVAKRIRLFGDEQCGVQINSTLNVGTTVKIIVK